MIERLRAKSWDEKLGVPPNSIYLPQHLKDVVQCSDAIIEGTKDFQGRAFGLETATISDRFSRILKIAAACHDLGKANSHFQPLVQSLAWQRIKQAVRHEWISWYLMQQNEMQSWIQSCLNISTSDVDWHIVLWAITGHHPAFGREIPRDRPVGSVDKIELYLSHQDYQSCLDLVATTLGQLSCPFRLESRVISAESDILDSIRDSIAESTFLWRQWFRDPVVIGLLAAVKNSLVAADVAGSALPMQMNLDFQSDMWHKRIIDELRIAPTSSQFDQLIADRLSSNGATNALRPFQAAVAEMASEVTLVKAGCGSGKTLAAYHWARERCPGKRLYICYPTTGTTTEGFRDYVFDKTEHEPRFGARLFHGRSTIDQRLILETPDEDSNEEDSLARIRSLQSWGAPIVTCTVDTVLGIVHNHRRAIYSWPGICNAAFVFDEIHSYDSSMFGALLAFLQKLTGVPVLLMTASLPAERLEKLRKVVSNRADGLVEIAGPKELESLDRYYQEIVSDDDVTDRVQQELDSNGKVLWVSNTVDRTINASQRCSEFANSNTVYHSRFRYVDRVKRHKDVIDAFAGSGSAIAWTSQVAEMSLDLSATLLVTDLAPIPALIQRLGRLNRRAKHGSDPIRPFIVHEPTNRRGEFSPLPYKVNQLNEAREWLSKLPKSISQEDLVATWESMNSSTRETMEVASTWIDGGFDRQVKELREGSPGVTVILREDRDRVLQGSVSLLEVTIPMSPRNGSSLSDWSRFQGAVVVDETQLNYSELVGGEWK